MVMVMVMVVMFGRQELRNQAAMNRGGWFLGAAVGMTRQVL
jgi:hypothetical protein